MSRSEPADPSRLKSKRPSAVELIHHGLVLVLLMVALGISLRPWWIWLFADYEAIVLGPTQLVGSFGAAFAIAAASLHLRWWRQGLWPERSLAIFRLAGCGLVLHWLVYLAFFQPHEMRLLWATWTAGACLFAALLTFRRLILKWLSPRLLTGLDLTVLYLCILVVGGELALRAIADLRPSVLLMRPDEGAERRIEGMRQPPGTFRFGFPLNSRSFYDEEHVDGDDRTLVVTIGDSFSQGVVPHYYHYTTVAERLLTDVDVDVEIYNVGIAGVDLREYLQLLLTEVLPLDPDLVVVGVFLGNDLTFDVSPATLSKWYDREQVLILQVPKRLSAVHAATGPPIAGAQPVLTSRGDLGAIEQTPEALATALPWVADTLAEQATFRIPYYQHLKLEIARDLSTQTADEYQQRFAVLREIADACGSTPVLFLVIPDEMQVDDALWEEIAALSDVPLERHRAQDLLLEWLSREGLPYIDPLPDLRAEAPLSDGRVHLYHLRDTHLNTRGNRVLGETLARALRPRLPPPEH